MVDLVQIYVLLLGTPSVTYSILGAVIGYAGWDRFIRKAYRIHVCVEEGSNLYEMKSFKIPLKKTGTLIHWTITKKDGQPEGKSYQVNSKHVYMTDRFNKSHIIQPYDNAFAYHPYGENVIEYVDEKQSDGSMKKVPKKTQKISFKKLAIADASALYQTTSKHGFLARTEALRSKIKVSKEGLYMGLAVGAVLGIFIGFNVIPHYIVPNGYVPSNLNATEFVRTVTVTHSSNSSSIIGLKP